MGYWGVRGYLLSSMVLKTEKGLGGILGYGVLLFVVCNGSDGWTTIYHHSDDDMGGNGTLYFS